MVVKFGCMRLLKFLEWLEFFGFCLSFDGIPCLCLLRFKAAMDSNSRKFFRFICSHSKFCFSFLVCLNVELREFVVCDQGFDVGLGYELGFDGKIVLE